MPITYRCDKARQITFAVWDGLTTVKEWIAVSEVQSLDPDWPAGESYIVDLRSGTMEEESFRQVFEPQAKRFRSRIHHPLKLALVASGNFYIMEEFQDAMMKQGFDCMIFTNLETACNWLGIDERDTENTFQELRSSLRKANAKGFTSD